MAQFSDYFEDSDDEEWEWEPQDEYNLEIDGEVIGTITSVKITKYDNETGFCLNAPISGNTTEELGRMLELCIEHEQYERAAKIRDELNSRE